MLAAAVWAVMAYVTPQAPPASPASWQFSATGLTVVGADGQELFTRAFPQLTGGTHYSPEADSRPGGRIALVDLSGDGVNEVLFGAASADYPPEAGLYVLDARGRDRFVLQPRHRVTFGSDTFSGPWAPYRLWVMGEGPTLTIFVVFIGPSKFPSLLLEVDAQGRVVSEYWSNGYIESVVRAPWNGQVTLFVGATHNDTRGGSLAIFPGGRAAGGAPAEQEAYRCRACPPGEPEQFVVFPRGALAAAYPGGEGQATVQMIRVEPNGRVHVNVGQVGPRDSAGYLRSSVWYTLESSLEPLEPEPTPGAFAVYQEALGRPYGEADRQALLPVRRWDAEAGKFVEVPRSGAPR
jgi:hypothetical protein